MTTEVEVLHALRTRGRDVATVWVLTGRLEPGRFLTAADGSRWRVVALQRARPSRLPVVGEHLVASEE
jgi:hypothetical protein